MLADHNLPQSYYEFIREYPREEAERLWSQGRTIRPYEEPQVPVAPWLNPKFDEHRRRHGGSGMCHIDKAELAHLIRTAEKQVPEPLVEHEDGTAESYTVLTRDVPLDRELREAGFTTASLEASSPDEDTSLINQLSEEPALVSYTAELTPKQQERWRSWAEWMRTHPNAQVDPLTARRIERERRTKYSGPVFKFRIAYDGAGRARADVLGPALTHEKRVQLAQAYVKRLLSNGGIPAAEAIAEWRRLCKQYRTLQAMEPSAVYDWQYSTYFEGDEDPTREGFSRYETVDDSTYDPEEHALGTTFEIDERELGADLADEAIAEDPLSVLRN